jgi:AAA+ ATPase superfamily predicted ATPase
MNFINRTQELETLNNEYRNTSAGFSVIYGRRRVGKTTLIQEYIKKKLMLYYYATETNLAMQLKAFIEDMRETLQLGNVTFESFEDALVYLSDNIGEKRLVLVIDEYQNLAKLDKGFSSMLQKIWDLHLKKSNIHLILCGSTISMMHSEILNYSAPLYGRSTSIIHLKPMLSIHIHDFVPGLSPEQFMKIFAAFGTIPKYLEMYQKEHSFEENVRNLILNKNAFLYSEGYFLLKQEINEVSTYFSILEAISKGATKLGNISSMLEMQSSQLTRYMEKLIDLGFIDKDVPVTEKNPLKSKLGRYRFRDNFLKFWFYYVYKNYRYLEIGLLEYVEKEIEQNFNDHFVSFAYEDYVKEGIMQNPVSYLGFVPLKIGRWWNNKEEIDLVAFDEENIAFIECKWRNKPVGVDVLKSIKKKAELLNPSLKHQYIIFSKSGCTDALENSEAKCYILGE